MASEDGTGGGTQGGGAPNPADMASPGGSGGTGGYGKAQNQQNHQGQQAAEQGRDPGQSRGERFDEEQGGGRGPGSVAGEASDPSRDEALERAADELIRDQREHQDRGQGSAEFERDPDS